jgi:acyl dehydratase
MAIKDSPANVQRRYFEDYVPGMVAEYGTVDVDAEEIVAFASKYDPQEFHTDPARAAQGEFGGLIASGWHTASLMMRLLVDHYLSNAASLGSPGVDELRWLAPVRPGNRLSIRVTVLEARRSRSKPHCGLVRSFIEVLNEGGAVVMTVKGMTLMLCRDTPDSNTGEP